MINDSEGFTSIQFCRYVPHTEQLLLQRNLLLAHTCPKALPSSVYARLGTSQRRCCYALWEFESMKSLSMNFTAIVLWRLKQYHCCLVQSFRPASVHQSSFSHLLQLQHSTQASSFCWAECQSFHCYVHFAVSPTSAIIYWAALVVCFVHKSEEIRILGGIASPWYCSSTALSIAVSTSSLDGDCVALTSTSTPLADAVSAGVFVAFLASNSLSNSSYSRRSSSKMRYVISSFLGSRSSSSSRYFLYPSNDVFIGSAACNMDK